MAKLSTAKVTLLYDPTSGELTLNNWSGATDVEVVIMRCNGGDFGDSVRLHASNPSIYLTDLKGYKP